MPLENQDRIDDPMMEALDETPEVPSNNDEALEIGETEGLLEELGRADGDLSLDDLRKLPGTKGLDDATLEKLWKEAQDAANPGAGTPAPTGRG